MGVPILVFVGMGISYDGAIWNGNAGAYRGQAGVVHRIADDGSSRYVRLLDCLGSEKEVTMENLLLGLIIFNLLFMAWLAIRLRHYLFPRGVEVYFNGQRMREGIDNDYVMKDGVPEFDFNLKARGDGTSDVVTIRKVPKVPTTELQAKEVVERKEDEDGEPYEVSRTELEEVWRHWAG